MPLERKRDWRRRIVPTDVVIFTWDYDVDFALTMSGRQVYYVQTTLHALEEIFCLPLYVFVSVSSYVREHTCQHYGIASWLIPCGLDHSIFRLLPGVHPQANRVMMLAWVRWKGYDTVQQAAELVRKEHPEVQLLAVDGLTPQQMAETYASSSLYLCVSLFEGFGLPVLEAMACGPADRDHRLQGRRRLCH